MSFKSTTIVKFSGRSRDSARFRPLGFYDRKSHIIFYIIILIMQSSDVKSRQTFRRGTEGVMVSNTTKDNIGNTNLVGVHLTMVINFKIYFNMTIKLTN